MNYPQSVRIRSSYNFLWNTAIEAGERQGQLWPHLLLCHCAEPSTVIWLGSIFAKAEMSAKLSQCIRSIPNTLSSRPTTQINVLIFFNVILSAKWRAWLEFVYLARRAAAPGQMTNSCPCQNEACSAMHSEFQCLTSTEHDIGLHMNLIKTLSYMSFQIHDSNSMWWR